jgi:3-vinyl bacteriochlorophyllide hydratase
MDQPRQARGPKRAPLYSPEERRRRDATAWTLVQGVLAPVQFLVFAVSLALVLRYLVTGDGCGRHPVVLVKTAVLYLIMITGSDLGEGVFGRWLFAPAFFWEDVVSMLVLALHTAYLWAWPPAGHLTPRGADAAGAGGLCQLRRQRHAVRAEAARRAAGQQQVRSGRGVRRPVEP